MTDATNGTTDMRSVRFRKEREAGWTRLEALVMKVERSGMTSLNFAEARDLASFYRQTVNSLSVAREISLDRALLAYLENLAARAYLVIYAPQARLTSVVARLFTQGIPQAVRRSGGVLLIGFGLMFMGALLGYFLYQQDSSWFYTFVPGELAATRTPAASPAMLERTLYGQDDTLMNSLASFASTLFSHNTQVAILVFSLGVFCTAPSFLLTFYNGTMLGAFFALFADKGLGYDAFAWLSIHGVTEISAICIACAGGVQLGLAVLMPGQMTRKDALRIRGRDATKLLILAAVMLLAAAILEGFFRQLVQSAELRLLIGWGIGGLWVAWLALAGRTPAEHSG
ncbi:stage II sporulation protein M [Aliiroseovarius sp. YM-037]|uniref:stage II sporulation protein M n=1 Tax=Aliiroseovarius sp. YM-037 TaxID=3341728 RepID=UPI003A802636